MESFFILHSYIIYRISVAVYDTFSIIEDISLLVIVVIAVIIFFIYLPIYYANFKYAFRSKHIWAITV